jgi:hypothetical protein
LTTLGDDIDMPAKMTQPLADAEEPEFSAPGQNQ